MGHSTIQYELALVFTTLPGLLFFLYLYHREPLKKHRKAIFRLTVLLGIIWMEFATQLFEEFWHIHHFYGLHIPPPHLFLEITLVAYLGTTLWDLWWNQHNVQG